MNPNWTWSRERKTFSNSKQITTLKSSTCQHCDCKFTWQETFRCWFSLKNTAAAVPKWPFSDVSEKPLSNFLSIKIGCSHIYLPYSISAFQRHALISTILLIKSMSLDRFAWLECREHKLKTMQVLCAVCKYFQTCKILF